jgi:nucleoside 2-deoxyribosyltransferase
MSNRIIYLAGPIEYEGDTWRTRATEMLAKLGFKTIDPLRNEQIYKVGKHLRSDLTDKEVVRRDLDDLRRTKLSGGLVLANLNKTSTGRSPIGTLFELMWSYDNSLPVVSIMGKNCDPHIKTHPWVRYCTTCETTSLTAAVAVIGKLFCDEEYKETEEDEGDA